MGPSVDGRIRRIVVNGMSVRYAEARKPKCATRCNYCGEGDYWNRVWPSGITLCKFLATRLGQSSRKWSDVVDVGCGTGIAALALARLGANVTFVDHIPQALNIVEKNCLLNGIRTFRTVCACWRDPGTRKSIGRFDMVIGADILYDPRDVRLVGGLMRNILKPGGFGILADPGHVSSDKILRELRRSVLNVDLRWISVSGRGPDEIRLIFVKQVRPSQGSVRLS